MVVPVAYSVRTIHQKNCAAEFCSLRRFEHAGSMQDLQFGLVRSLTLTCEQTVVRFARLDYFFHLRLLFGREYSGQLSAH